jgi:hypothetical protein
MSNQPIMSNSQGAILTIGMVLNGERVACVEPYGLDQVDPDKITFCDDLVTTWRTANMAAWLAMLSQDCYVAFLSADGMQDGAIPHREDYTPTTHVGAQAHPSLPSNVTGLIAYYEDPADVVPGHRIRVAKTFVPGIPDVQVVGQQVLTAQILLMATYSGQVQGGFASTLYPGQDWYRMLSVPKPRATDAQIPRTATNTPRGYVCTQRRRLIPR